MECSILFYQIYLMQLGKNIPDKSEHKFLSIASLILGI